MAKKSSRRAAAGGDDEPRASREAWDWIIAYNQRQIDAYEEELKSLLSPKPAGKKPPGEKRVERVRKTLADRKTAVKILRASRKKLFGG